MPIKYEFVSKINGNKMMLVEIDEEVCLDMGIDCDPNDYSPMFMFIVNIGTLPSVQIQGKIDLDLLNKKLDDVNLELTDKEKSVIRKYLVHDYDFKCWSKS